MDDIVAQAMARWPDVPAVYGWLRLDRRGRWLVKGEPIGHRPTVDFINRNYLRDEHGRHYFQNGPQRVFIDLDLCPFVLSLAGPAAVTPPGLVTHTGQRVDRPSHVWIDPNHGVIIEFELGIGSVLDRDLPALADCFLDEAGRPLDAEGWEAAFAGDAPVPTLVLATARLPALPLAGKTFDFVRAPRPDAGEEACT